MFQDFKGASTEAGQPEESFRPSDGGETNAKGKWRVFGTIAGMKSKEGKKISCLSAVAHCVVAF